LKRFAPACLAAIVLALLLAAPGASGAQRLSKAKADTAIEKKVRRVYRNQLDGRMVLSDCSRLSATKFDCVYDVFAELQDHIDAERYGDEIGDDGILWTGTGTVKLTKSGALRVRVTRPS
jgi:hypothetical protein